MNSPREPDANAIIDALGGTTAVASLCDIKSPSVSEWRRKNEIPKPWLRYFKATRPDVFGPAPAKEGEAAA